MVGTLGVLNPFRYRGYCYDMETELYYLNSRYYDPMVGRFINADGYVITGQGIESTNMFAYCGNNPVNRADPSGQFWGLVIVAVVAVVCAVGMKGCNTSPYVADKVILDVESRGRTARVIDSATAPISENEYRIAMRTGEKDYHFMVQHNDGSWSHKPGIFPTRVIEGKNPSVISWDCPVYDIKAYVNGCKAIEVDSLIGYYDSKTIYFAISKK